MHTRSARRTICSATARLRQFRRMARPCAARGKRLDSGETFLLRPVAGRLDSDAASESSTGRLRARNVSAKSQNMLPFFLCRHSVRHIKCRQRNGTFASGSSPPHFRVHPVCKPARGLCNQLARRARNPPSRMMHACGNSARRRAPLQGENQKIGARQTHKQRASRHTKPTIGLDHRRNRGPACAGAQTPICASLSRRSRHRLGCMVRALRILPIATYDNSESIARAQETREHKDRKGAILVPLLPWQNFDRIRQPALFF